MENSNVSVPGRAGYDLNGKTFGRLVVQSIAASDAHGRRRWKCLCACGKVVNCVSTSLLGGRSQSCGCLQKELASKAVTKYAMPSTVKHGQSRTPLYHQWTSMIGRCENTNHPKFKYWGGRGISVCPEWRADFLVFKEWAESSGWKEGLQLDREKSELDYRPDNCQWLTASEHSTKTQTEHWSKK